MVSQHEQETLNIEIIFDFEHMIAVMPFFSSVMS
jgi:hypothetical protein